MLPDTDITLTQEQISQLKQAKDLIPKIKAQVKKAQSAGIEVSAQLEELDALQKQVDSLWRVYVAQRGANPGI